MNLMTRWIPPTKPCAQRHPSRHPMLRSGHGAPTPVDDAAAEGSTPETAGCGWFESSQALSAGLMVSEHPVRDDAASLRVGPHSGLWVLPWGDTLIATWTGTQEHAR